MTLEQRLRNAIKFLTHYDYEYSGDDEHFIEEVLAKAVRNIIVELTPTRKMIADDIGYRPNTTMRDCLARPDVREVGLLFSDLVEQLANEEEAWGEGEVTPATSRIYGLSVQVREFLTKETER